MEDISIQELRNLLDYDPETGKLTWKPREPRHFEERPMGMDPVIACNSWNTRYAGKEALNSEVRGILRGKLFGKLVYAHRIAWAIYYGRWPENIIHKNGDGTDNRIENLASISNSEMAYRREHNKRKKKAEAAAGTSSV